MELWVGTSAGVNLYKNSLWRHYGREDGLIWDDTDRNGFLADKRGDVFISTSRGFSRLIGNREDGSITHVPLVISSLQLGGIERPITSVLTAAHNQSSLLVRASVLTFAAENRVRLRYRLHPAEQEWSMTEHREIRYSSLPAGRHTLELQVLDQENVWHAEPVRLELEILPPWWQTAWAYLGIWTFLTAAM
jgi:hypothetical protein